jgi:hypothetical protein
MIRGNGGQWLFKIGAIWCDLVRWGTEDARERRMQVAKCCACLKARTRRGFEAFGTRLAIGAAGPDDPEL